MPDNGALVVGLRTGSIVIVKTDDNSQTTVMQSHNDGETWGLDLTDTHVWTSGDDNQVKGWDPHERKCTATSKVSD